MTKEEQGKKMGQIIAKAWADEAFKQRLLADATAVLKEEGVPVPHGLTVKAVENSRKVFHLVIPPKAPEGQLDDEQLAQVAGGACWQDRTWRHSWCGSDGQPTGSLCGERG
jgi:hypothetical protein